MSQHGNASRFGGVDIQQYENYHNTHLEEGDLTVNEPDHPISVANQRALIQMDEPNDEWNVVINQDPPTRNMTNAERINVARTLEVLRSNNISNTIIESFSIFVQNFIRSSAPPPTYEQQNEPRGPVGEATPEMLAESNRRMQRERLEHDFNEATHEINRIPVLNDDPNWTINARDIETLGEAMIDNPVPIETVRLDGRPLNAQEVTRLETYFRTHNHPAAGVPQTAGVVNPVNQPPAVEWRQPAAPPGFHIDPATGNAVPNEDIDFEEQDDEAIHTPLRPASEILRRLQRIRDDINPNRLGLITGAIGAAGIDVAINTIHQGEIHAGAEGIGNNDLVRGPTGFNRLPKIQSEPALKLHRYSGIANNKLWKNKTFQKLLDSDDGKQLFGLIQDYSATSNGIENLKRELKAAELVKQWLSKRDWECLTQHGYVAIPSKKNKMKYYIVFEDPDKRVHVILKQNVGQAGIINKDNSTKEYVDVYDHKKVVELCGIVSETDKYGKNYVRWDKLLTKIMALKTDEEYYLKNSNEINY